MYILLLPVILLNLVIWAFFLFALYRLYRTWMDDRKGAMGVWLAIVAAPFIAFVVERAMADRKEEARLAEVAAFERTSIPKTYPRTLEVHGFMNDQSQLMFLANMDIDRIYQFQSRAHRGTLNAEIITLDPACQTLGRQLLERVKSKRRIKRLPRAQLSSCLKLERRKIASERENIPAIVFLSGKRTTLKMDGNVSWATGNYEARLRTPQRDVLLDYAERPYIPRPEYPLLFGLNGLMKTGNTDRLKYRIDRTLFYLRAVGLLE
ncbi:MAG: hypothetical protein RIC14_05200 [Filomicrobium sp.]